MASIDFEGKYWWNGADFVLGIDEAGRGAIAGPLVVAGVIFPAFYDNPIIHDSKTLSDRKRRKLYETIIKDAIEYHIEIITVEEIENYNIYKATQLGMERIVKMSNKKLNAVLTDAMPLPNVKDLPVDAIIKGDQKSQTIAAASILAKVTRDNLMIEYDKQYPEYGFKNHKGYCTAKHVSNLKEYGVISIHRKNFEPVCNYFKHDEQISIDEFIEK